MWYLGLANNAMTVSDAEKTLMVQNLYAMGRPDNYDFSRRNKT